MGGEITAVVINVCVLELPAYWLNRKRPKDLLPLETDCRKTSRQYRDESSKMRRQARSRARVDELYYYLGRKRSGCGRNFRRKGGVVSAWMVERGKAESTVVDERLNGMRDDS